MSHIKNMFSASVLLYKGVKRNHRAIIYYHVITRGRPRLRDSLAGKSDLKPMHELPSSTILEFALAYSYITPPCARITAHFVHGAQGNTHSITLALKAIALTKMDDTADQPLMRRSSQDEAQDEIDLSDVSLLLEKNLRNPGLFVWLLTFSAGISGLLFGCK